MNLNRRNFLYVAGFVASASALTGSLDPLRVFLKKPAGRRGPLFRDDPFREKGRSLVSVVGGRDVKRMVREAVARIGGISRLGVRGKRVLVKPNVVSGRGHPTTTNPEVVRAVVQLLYEEGASKVIVGDMSAMTRLPTLRNMEKTGIKRAAEEAGAEVVAFEDHEWFTVPLRAGTYISEVDVSEWIFKVDRVVNLPVIKTHRSAQYSICFKNFVGATHFSQRPYFVDSRHWEEVVAEINLAYRPDLNIVDGTRTMVEGGPWRGEERETNLVIASGDRVAADVVGLGIIKAFGMGKGVVSRGVWEQRQIKRAVEAGLGAGKRQEIDLRAGSLTGDRDFGLLMEKVKAHLAQGAPS